MSSVHSDGKLITRFTKTGGGRVGLIPTLTYPSGFDSGGGGCVLSDGEAVSGSSCESNSKRLVV